MTEFIPELLEVDDLIVGGKVQDLVFPDDYVSKDVRNVIFTGKKAFLENVSGEINFDENATVNNIPLTKLCDGNRLDKLTIYGKSDVTVQIIIFESIDAYLNFILPISFSLNFCKDSIFF